MKLIATHAILYQSTQYAVGQSLPTNNPGMVEAWLEAGTAVWQEETEKATPAKAKPATAEPGLAGDSKNGETAENVVGKVPKTPTRNKGGKKNG